MAKIRVNDNLTNIFNYIQSADKVLSYSDLVQYVIDYDLYQEFYLNNAIINRIFDEKNRSMIQKGGKKIEEKGIPYL